MSASSPIHDHQPTESSSPIAERPRCRVGYLWPKVEDCNWETVASLGLVSVTSAPLQYPSAICLCWQTRVLIVDCRQYEPDMRSCKQPVQCINNKMHWLTAKLEKQRLTARRSGQALKYYTKLVHFFVTRCNNS